MLSEFQDRVAVITGAATGIGRALATALAAKGARVVLADVKQEELQQLCQEISSTGSPAVAVVTDVSQPAHLERLAVEAFRNFGQVDILCNNAGVSLPRCATWENSVEDWQWILGINLMGVVHGINSFLPRMIKQGTPGVVLNTSSILGLQVGTTNAAYPVSKHGVVVMSECISNELRRRKIPISVHVLCPGFVNTQILDSMSLCPTEKVDSTPPERVEQTKNYDQWFERQQRAGLDPEEVAEQALAGIQAGEFYIVAPRSMKKLAEFRLRSIMEDLPPNDEEFVKEHAEEFGFEPPPPRPDEVLD